MNHKFLFPFITFLMFISLSANGAGYHAKYDRFSKLVKPEIVETLISHGVCGDRTSCINKELVLYGPEKKYLKIDVYEVNDLQVLNDVVSDVIRVYSSGRFNFSIILEAHKGAHKANKPFASWFKDDIYLTLEIQGEE